MTHLDTPDPDGAKAFYTALFGWTTETFDLGATSITMYRLPGYVGGEPEEPVSREVVATTSAVAGSAPAHWSADFRVHDVDATAATAEKLNGTTVVAPSDTPTGRTAVLADPAAPPSPSPTSNRHASGRKRLAGGPAETAKARMGRRCPIP